MTLCRVIGDIVSTVKHEHFHAEKLMICQPIDTDGRAKGEHIIACDRVQAGPGDTVLVLREGNGARQLWQKKVLSIRSSIVAIVDSVEDELRDAPVAEAK